MITSLQHVALGVPDLKAGVDFYEAFGLEKQERGDHVAMRCFGRAQDQIVLIENGSKRKLHHVSLDGLWFRDPEGTLVNVQVADAAPPMKDEAAPAINRPGLITRMASRGCPPFDTQPRPRRMGHIIIFAKDVIAQSNFYCETLGLRLSDRIVDGFAAFMRTAGDSDHHVIAMLKSAAPGFHHASFEMPGIDEAELGAARLKAKGYKHAWGPGRHGVGSNYFHYFRDPWNGMAEYFHDIAKAFIASTCRSATSACAPKEMPSTSKPKGRLPTLQETPTLPSPWCDPGSVKIWTCSWWARASAAC